MTRLATYVIAGAMGIQLSYAGVTMDTWGFWGCMLTFYIFGSHEDYRGFKRGVKEMADAFRAKCKEMKESGEM